MSSRRVTTTRRTTRHLKEEGDDDSFPIILLILVLLLIIAVPVYLVFIQKPNVQDNKANNENFGNFPQQMRQISSSPYSFSYNPQQPQFSPYLYSYDTSAQEDLRLQEDDVFVPGEKQKLIAANDGIDLLWISPAVVMTQDSTFAYSLAQANINAQFPNICVPIVTPAGPIPVCLKDIVNAFKFIWSIIQASKPVVNITTDMASAFPTYQDESGKLIPIPWDAMYNWQRRTYSNFKVRIKAGIKKLFRFEFDVQALTNGKVIGDTSESEYISTVQFFPKNIYASLGTHANVDVNIARVFNASTDPNKVLACMEIMIVIKVTSWLFSDKFWNCSLFLYADNRLYEGVCGKWE